MSVRDYIVSGGGAVAGLLDEFKRARTPWESVRFRAAGRSSARFALAGAVDYRIWKVPAIFRKRPNSHGCGWRNLVVLQIGAAKQWGTKLFCFKPPIYGPAGDISGLRMC
jgi:hypothetical protein